MIYKIDVHTYKLVTQRNEKTLDGHRLFGRILEVKLIYLEPSLNLGVKDFGKIITQNKKKLTSELVTEF